MDEWDKKTSERLDRMVERCCEMERHLALRQRDEPEVAESKWEQFKRECRSACNGSPLFIVNRRDS